MNYDKMAKNLEGLQTVSSAAKTLGVGRRTAVNYISKLKKYGYVRTSRGKGKIRLYEISGVKFVKKSGTELYDFINKHSPIKVREPYRYVIHDKITAEDAIPRAIETKDFRIILAAMHLFRLVEDWPELNRHANARGVQKAVGALYELARKYMRVRRIDKRTANAFMKAKTMEKFIVPNMRSRDFLDIEKKWEIHIPFNKSDMERY